MLDAMIFCYALLDAPVPRPAVRVEQGHVKTASYLAEIDAPIPALFPKRMTPVAVPKPKLVVPTIYALTDATGQVWTHADPAWLRSWVAGRNRNRAARQAVRYYFNRPAAVYQGGACISGRCPR